MATLLASINDQILEAHGLWDKWAPHVFQSLASGNPLRMKQFRKELFNAMLDRYHYWKVEHQKSADELSSYNLKVDADQREAKLPDGSEKAGSPRAAEGIGGQRQRAAKWEDIEICFLSEYRVQIRNGTNTESGNYDELGFADRRAKRGDPKPNQAWVTLRAMAEQNGIIQDGTKMGATWPKVEKRIQEIRKVLRKHFSITADPIPFVKGIGYQAVFKISCSPAYAT
jgi:hypothetical protein